ncbi:uncharacterized protein [Nicotiana tomentosiformis]|uniref:uncharacterized protein n=1 Tax=Nicotiana tomentosiformis TaxID=4098 RepID=UPI00388CDF62
MAREIEMGTLYEQVVEIARRIEGQFVRGQSSRPTYSAPPASQGAPLRPYFNAIRESSYRPPAIQVFSSRCSGPQGQTQVQSYFALIGCYECAELGHVRRFYPRLRGKAVQQGHEPMITAPVAALAVRSSRGGVWVGRGFPRGGGQSGDMPLSVYAFPTRQDVVASDSLITGIISVCGKDVSVLFDPGSTYSYVSSLFAHYLGVSYEPLGALVYVSTLVGNSVVVDRIYQSCIVTFFGYETRADLLLFNMTEFEDILGMDSLSLYHVVLDCHAKTITLEIPELPRLE